jgi:antitoxin ChpS
VHRSKLRKVGGSVMLVVPPALLEILRLQPGASVGVTVERGRMVIDPRPRPRYTLDELLSQCNPKAARARKDREWVSGKPAGAELI